MTGIDGSIADEARVIYRAELSAAQTVVFTDPWQQPLDLADYAIPVRFVRSPADVAYWCRLLSREDWASAHTIASFVEVATRLLSSPS